MLLTKTNAPVKAKLFGVTQYYYCITVL